jgi:hypothetical protein
VLSSWQRHRVFPVDALAPGVDHLTAFLRAHPEAQGIPAGLSQDCGVSSSAAAPPVIGARSMSPAEPGRAKRQREPADAASSDSDTVPLAVRLRLARAAAGAQSAGPADSTLVLSSPRVALVPPPAPRVLTPAASVSPAVPLRRPASRPLPIGRAAQPPPSQLLLLPDFALVVLMSYLPPVPDRARLAFTCRRLRRLVMHPLLAASLCPGCGPGVHGEPGEVPAAVSVTNVGAAARAHAARSLGPAGLWVLRGMCAAAAVRRLDLAFCPRLDASGLAGLGKAFPCVRVAFRPGGGACP